MYVQSAHLCYSRVFVLFSVTFQILVDVNIESQCEPGLLEVCEGEPLASTISLYDCMLLTNLNLWLFALHVLHGCMHVFETSVDCIHTVQGQ